MLSCKGSAARQIPTRPTAPMIWQMASPGKNTCIRMATTN